MEIEKDSNGSPYIEWEQYDGNYKRAWTQGGHDTDWAGIGRYLNVVRCNKPGQPGGNPTDFPIFNENAPAEEIQTKITYSRMAAKVTFRHQGQDSGRANPK